MVLVETYTRSVKEISIDIYESTKFQCNTYLYRGIILMDLF